MTIDRIPERVALRPSPSDWGLDELLTLAEAAALHWPPGPQAARGLLTARNLRAAAEAGVLGTVKITRKRLTTRRQIAEMSRCQRAPAPAMRPTSVATRPGIGMTPEEARASGNSLRRPTE
jgi:hypothetical protein